MDENYKIKWVKYNLHENVHKEFRKKAESDGYSLYEASRLLVLKYINGDFDLE